MYNQYLEMIFLRNQEKEETALFLIGWTLVVTAAIFLILYKILPLPYDKLMMPCIFRSVTGLYCPGCGGTRAVSALLHGHLITSFVCHPLVPITAATSGWFLISQTIERISRRRIQIGMKYRDFYIWAALGIVIANFLASNLLLVLWDIDPLKAIALSL